MRKYRTIIQLCIISVALCSFPSPQRPSEHCQISEAVVIQYENKEKLLSSDRQERGWRQRCLLTSPTGRRSPLHAPKSTPNACWRCQRGPRLHHSTSGFLAWWTRGSAMPASARRHKRCRNLPYGPKFARQYCTEDWERCLYLFVNPAGWPYDNSDYERALKERGLLEYVHSVGPKRANGAWLLKLKTTEAKQTVAKLRALLVKGRYCAIVDPCQKETYLKVHGVPLHVSNETVRKAFRPYGVVQEVIRETCPVRGLEHIETTTRHVSMLLKQKVKKTDLPLRLVMGDTAVRVFVPGRTSVCLTCGERGHRRLVCPAVRSSRRGRKRPTDDNQVPVAEVLPGNDGGANSIDDDFSSESDETASSFSRLGISHGGSGATPSQP